MKSPSTTAQQFDETFEAGEAILDSLDLSQARRRNQDQRRVNVDFPLWMIDQLDQEAHRIGVTRQSVIKIWLAERLETLNQRQRMP
ncbi:MAG: CopG family transcriptional regulator [Prochlorococcaceae cyanobacterium]